jgi:hypothetical protein
MKTHKLPRQTPETLTTTCPKCGANTDTATITDRGWVSRTPQVYGVLATCSCGARLSHFLPLEDATPAQVCAFQWKLITWEKKQRFTPPVIGAVLDGVVEPQQTDFAISFRMQFNRKRLAVSNVLAVGEGRSVGVWKQPGTPLCVDVWFCRTTVPFPEPPALEFEYDLPLPDDEGELGVLAHLFMSATKAQLQTEFRGLVAHPPKTTAPQ